MCLYFLVVLRKAGMCHASKIETHLESRFTRMHQLPFFSLSHSTHLSNPRKGQGEVPHLCKCRPPSRYQKNRRFRSGPRRSFRSQNSKAE